MSPSAILDAKKSRPRAGGASFSLENRLVRLVWTIVWLALAAWTPRVLWGWRSVLLRAFGATVGRHCDVRGSARVWYPPYLVLEDHAVVGPGATIYNMAQITIGARALVSQRAFLCGGSHDFDDPDFQLIAKPIWIGSDAWIAAEAFVGPGVRVGDGAVLGARAVALRDIEAWGVYSGNPATKLRDRRRG